MDLLLELTVTRYWIVVFTLLLTAFNEDDWDDDAYADEPVLDV